MGSLRCGGLLSLKISKNNLNLKLGPSIVERPNIQIHLRIETKLFLRYHEVFNGVVSEEALTINDNQVAVNLRQLIPGLKESGKIRISIKTQSQLGKLNEEDESTWVVNI